MRKEQIEHKYLIKFAQTRRKYCLLTAKKAGGNFKCHIPPPPKGRTNTKFNPKAESESQTLSGSVCVS
jgi:hypothetical protein